MTSFEDTANALGQLVVQVSANAVRSNDLAKSTKESYDTAMNYIQELRKAHKDQQELIEDLQKRLEEQPEEPSAKRLRTEAPWTRPRRDPARSEYAESQVESQSGFLCYRCHKHCGSSAKNCEVEIPDLEMSSVLDLYTRIAHRGKKDERNELDKVVEEFGRRGYRLPEDGKVAKRMREALQLYWSIGWFRRRRLRRLHLERRLLRCWTTTQSRRVTSRRLMLRRLEIKAQK